MKTVLPKLLLVLSLVWMTGSYAHADEVNHEHGMDLTSADHLHGGADDPHDIDGETKHAESPLHCGGGFLLSVAPVSACPTLVAGWGASAATPDLFGSPPRPDDPPPRT